MASLIHNPPTISGYKILSQLGEGAGSTIYAVQQNRTQQVYALKHVVRVDDTDQKFIDQAIHEYEVASQFSHSGLRKAYRLIKKKKWFKVKEVMVLFEPVNGKTLMAHRPSKYSTIQHVFLHAAEALGALHDGGMIHADLKPSNMIVTASGEVKLIDFGQSCAVGTVKERIQGTPEYMAPEQFYRGALDARTDIYNLAATFYWCVTQTHVPMPSKGEMGDEGAVCGVEFGDVAVPDGVKDVILRSLSPSPGGRPECMKEFIKAFG